MDSNYLKEIKLKMENYREQLQNRENSISEIKELSTLLHEIKSHIRELEDNNYSSVADKKLLNEYLKQEQDYVDLINEYAGTLREPEQNINYQEAEQKLEILSEFEEVSKRIKEIEKESKKIAGGYQIGTNLVETVSAEGRKKDIHQNLLDEYNTLSKRKRELIKEQRNAHEYFKKLDEAQVHPIEEKETDVVYYNDALLNNYPTYSEDIDIFDQMTDEEKLTYYQHRMKNIMNAKNTGKKKTIKIHGVQYTIPKKYESDFRDCYNKANNLMQQVNENTKDNNIDLEDAVEESLYPTELPKFTKDKEKVSNAQGWTIFDENEQDLFIEEVSETATNEEEIENNSKRNWFQRIKKKILAIAAAVVAGVVALTFIPSLMGKNNKKEEESKDSFSIVELETDDVSKKESYDDILEVGTQDIPEKTTNNDLFEKETQDMPEKTTDNDLFEKETQDIPEKTTDNDLFEVETKNVSEQQEDNKKINNEELEISDKQNILNDIDLNDYINVKEGINIYDNVYDAKNKTNGLKPYFDANMTRVVMGITYEYEGQIIYCDYHDTDANEKASLLKEVGANVVSIMTSVDGQNYEGAYNINDVLQVLSKQNDINENKNNQKVLK